MAQLSKLDFLKSILSYTEERDSSELNKQETLKLRLKYHRQLILPYYLELFSDMYILASILKTTRDTPYLQSLMFGLGFVDETSIKAISEIMFLDDFPFDDEYYREVALSLHPDYASLGKDLPSGPLLKYQFEAELAVSRIKDI